MASYFKGTLLERLMLLVSMEPMSGCWLWTGATRGGYGRIKMGGRKGEFATAHRLSFELHRGPIPNGLVLDHLCRNRSCVNPHHLEPVTAEENTRRGDVGKFQARRTHCPLGHPYDAANTVPNKRAGRTPTRACKLCNRLKAQRHRAKLLIKQDLDSHH